MTQEERGQMEAIRGELLTLLQKLGEPVSAADLVARYIKEHRSERELTELALSSLLNRGVVTANREMQISKGEIAA